MRLHPEFDYKKAGVKEQRTLKMGLRCTRYVCPFDIESNPDYCKTCHWKKKGED